jgi:zinc protease
LALIMLAAGATTPAFAVDDVHQFALDNGLQLIVKEDHRAPVVVSQIWYRVGSGYENAGTTGVSHVLEHMMFKGTKRHPAGEFSRIIAENGGSENAFTSRDYTAYFQRLEKSRLPVSFELEADRMRNLTLPPEEFAKELKVVMEERRMRTEDDPQSLTYERFNAAAFVSSPYHHPVIGWMNDLENLTVADLRQWYQTWYAPNNAILVVVGDVEPQQVLALARQYFGPLQPSEMPKLKPRRELDPNGLRQIAVKAPAKLPYLLMGYQVPGVKTAAEDWEPYALAVLSGILDGGESARLAREVVRGGQVAASAGASYGLYSRQSDLFLFELIPASGRTVAELESAVRAQVRRLQEQLVSPDELARVKAQVLAQDVYGRDSVFYQAMRIGQLAAVGLDWRLADAYLDRIKAVTAEQVQAVARRYLKDERLTVAMLEPQPVGETAVGHQAQGGGRNDIQ